MRSWIGLTSEDVVAAAEASQETFESMLGYVNLMLSGKLPRHLALLDSALIGLLTPKFSIGMIWYRLAACCALAGTGNSGEQFALTHAVRTATARGALGA